MIVFAHGQEGRPNGTKVRRLLQAGFEVRAPDFRGMPLIERVALLEEVTEGGGIVLGGSSYGGLAAAIVAQRHPERFKGMFLLAPALHLAEPPAADPKDLAAPAGLPVTILHGTPDEVVPVTASREYRDRSGENVRLVEVDDGHRLHASLDFMAEIVRELLG